MKSWRFHPLFQLQAPVWLDSFPNPLAFQSEVENLQSFVFLLKWWYCCQTWTKLGQISWEFEIKVLHLRKASWKGLVVFCAFHHISRFICVLYVVESQNMILCTFCHTLWSRSKYLLFAITLSLFSTIASLSHQKGGTKQIWPLSHWIWVTLCIAEPRKTLYINVLQCHTQLLWHCVLQSHAKHCTCIAVSRTASVTLYIEVPRKTPVTLYNVHACIAVPHTALLQLTL